MIHVPFISLIATLPVTHTDGKETSITPTPVSEERWGGGGSKREEKRRNSPEEGDNEKHAWYFWEEDLNQRKMYFRLIHSVVFSTENVAPLFNQLNRVRYHLEDSIQSSLGIHKGLVLHIPHRYQNLRMLKFLTWNGIVFAYNLHTFPHILKIISSLVIITTAI